MSPEPLRGELSRQSKRIFAYIVRVQETRGAPPTVREICRSLGIRSTNGVTYHLERLEREGWIHRRRGCARGITPVSRRAPPRVASQRPARIPVLGRIAAGLPVSSEENREGSLEADRLGRIKPDFALRVTGDSMRDAGILEGDLVLVREESDPAEGDIVVALIGDEATVKRFFRDGEGVALRPENPAYAPIRVGAEDPELRILGKVVGVYRELGR